MNSIIQRILSFGTTTRTIETVYAGAYRTASPPSPEPIEKKPMLSFEKRHPKLYATRHPIFGAVVLVVAYVVLVYAPLQLGRLLSPERLFGYSHTNGDYSLSEWMTGIGALLALPCIYALYLVLGGLGKFASQMIDWTRNSRKRRIERGY